MSRSFNSKKRFDTPTAEYVRNGFNAPFRRENRKFCRRIEKYGLEACELAYPVSPSARSQWWRDCW